MDMLVYLLCFGIGLLAGAMLLWLRLHQRRREAEAVHQTELNRAEMEKAWQTRIKLMKEEFKTLGTDADQPSGRQRSQSADDGSEGQQQKCWQLGGNDPRGDAAARRPDGCSLWLLWLALQTQKDSFLPGLVIWRAPCNAAGC